MQFNFSLFTFITILFLVIRSRKCFVGAAQYEDFQRSNFYANEQGNSVEPGRGIQPVHKIPAAKFDQSLVHRNVKYYQPYMRGPMTRVEGNNVPLQQRYDHLLSDKEIYADSDVSSNVRMADKRSQYQPRQRAEFERAYTYQQQRNGIPGGRNVENVDASHKENEHGLRQIRKSCAEPSNSNWKWGFKRKLKSEHSFKDPGAYGNFGHSSFRPREQVYSRNPMSEAMVANGHFNADMEVDSGFPRHSLAQNHKLADFKMKDHHPHFIPRQDIEDHFHKMPLKSFASARLHPHLVQSAAADFNHDSNFQQRADNHRAWGGANPPIFNAPKNDAKNNAYPAAPCERMAENQMSAPALQLGRDGQGVPGQIEPMKVDMQADTASKVDTPRLAENQADPASRVDGRFDNNRLDDAPRVDNEQPNYNYKYDPAQKADTQKVEGSQRMDPMQRIDHPAVESNWRDDSAQRITNAQRMKTNPNYPNLARIDHRAEPIRANPQKSSPSNEEIRYLVFSPAEFSPKTLRAVLGEPNRESIPYCTLDEYRMESASLQAKAYDLQDRHLQYRGKPNVNDLITRLPVTNGPRKRHFERRPNKRDWMGIHSCPRAPEHLCTATPPEHTDCPTATVYQTKSVDPTDSYATECLYDCLTRSTRRVETQICMSSQEKDGLCSRAYGTESHKPSLHIMQLRAKFPVISHFENTIRPTLSLLQGNGLIKGHECRKNMAAMTEAEVKNTFQGSQEFFISFGSKSKRNSDLDLLSRIIRDLKTTAKPIPRKNDPTIGPQEEDIIEKYLTFLMEAQSRVRNQDKSDYRGGQWLGKLLSELADVRIKSKTMMKT